MAEFEPFDEGVEVNGQTVLSVIEGFPDHFEDRGRQILRSHGIEDPEPGEWYPQQAWLDSFAEIREMGGQTTLRQIGKSIPKNADVPDGVDSVVGALKAINEGYKMNHRGGEIGHYEGKQVEEDLIEVNCRNPYPCTFDQGIVEGFAQALGAASLTEVTEVSDHCRAEGGEECTYHVEWL